MFSSFTVFRVWCRKKCFGFGRLIRLSARLMFGAKLTFRAARMWAARGFASAAGRVWRTWTSCDAVVVPVVAVLSATWWTYLVAVPIRSVVIRWLLEPSHWRRCGAMSRLCRPRRRVRRRLRLSMYPDPWVPWRWPSGRCGSADCWNISPVPPMFLSLWWVTSFLKLVTFCKLFLSWKQWSGSTTMSIGVCRVSYYNGLHAAKPFNRDIM